MSDWWYNLCQTKKLGSVLICTKIIKNAKNTVIIIKSNFWIYRIFFKLTDEMVYNSRRFLYLIAQSYHSGFSSIEFKTK